MRSATRSALALLAATAVVLGTLPTVLAHGDEMQAADMDSPAGAMDMDAAAEAAKPASDSVLPSYFSHPEHRGTLYAHIVLMCVGWIIVLPTAVMLSLARSRFTLPVQFVFLATNTLALILGISYNASTPDLYPNNAHHKIGWVATWVVCAQVLVSLIGRFAGVMKRTSPAPHGGEQQAFIPVSTEAMAEHERISDPIYLPKYRHSHDSGQGTEPHTDSLRSNSVSTSGAHSPHHPEDRRMYYGDDEDDDDLELKTVELGSPKNENSSWLAKVSGRISGKISGRTWQFLLFGYNFVDRTILLLGYVALATGIITWARFFEGHGIFGGLAHWIKGSIFFWLGILTTGRWSGSFGDLGWAWNVKPKRASARWIPSAEFVEGFLIFLYGSTNIFLEHLGNASIGQAEFSPQDLEHVSITVLFIGGGALAMLIESVNIRELLNTTASEAAHAHPVHAYSEEEREALQPPRQYEFSVNPIPALVILLLGIMMSSHTQQTMLSSMVHKQWGNLFAFAACARGFSYLLVYLRPPRSVLPSRPPTELVAAFCLMSGGIIFCASSSDTVAAMAYYDLDAMFFYTVTMGFMGLVMAWVVLLLALKGWAVRREAGKARNAWNLSARV